MMDIERMAGAVIAALKKGDRLKVGNIEYLVKSRSGRRSHHPTPRLSTQKINRNKASRETVAILMHKNHKTKIFAFI